MYKLLTAAFLFCFILESCNKDENKTLSTPPLKKSTSTCCGDSTGQTLYLYDGLDKLTGVRYSDNNGHWTNIDFTYDNQGRLVSAKDTADYNGAHTILFEHNSNGQIIKRSSYSSFGGNPNINTYAYDNGGRLIADSTYDYWGPGVYFYRSFTYDQNGNVVTRKSYQKNGGVFQLKETMQMQYDSKPNPYYDLQPLYYHHFQWDLCLSRNNCIVTNDGINAPDFYTFQYNADDSPAGWTSGTVGTYEYLHGNYYY